MTTLSWIHGDTGVAFYIQEVGFVLNLILEVDVASRMGSTKTAEGLVPNLTGHFQQLFHYAPHSERVTC